MIQSFSSLPSWQAPTCFLTNANMDRVHALKQRLLLRSKDHHEQYIMKSPTLKDAHVYCVIHDLPTQQYGFLLEKFIRTKFHYNKNKDEDCMGDCSKNGENVEIKVSLGGNSCSKFNYVQLRPSHDCHTYLLTAYHLSHENVEQEGELYIFKVSNAAMKQLIVRHGTYAHGTLCEHGKITLETLQTKKEYALRPTIHNACWNALLPFRIMENDL